MSVVGETLSSSRGDSHPRRTDPNYTGLLLIVDRSGSMDSIRDDMIGGLTDLLRRQADDEGLTTVDIVHFDDVVETVATMADPTTVQVDLLPRGMTALHDAVGRSLVEYGARLAALPEHARPGTVIVVVATDGHENSSKEFTAEMVRTMVAKQQETYDWQFVFLGANQDAVLTGASLGFDAGSSIDFDAEGDAVRAVNVAASALISDRRRGSTRDFTEEERGSSSRRSS